MDASSGPLEARRIGVPEARQLDLFADMLERRGARVMRCPLVAIHDAPDPAPVRAWVDDVLRHGLDDMIWMTGEGVRRLAAFVERLDDDTAARFWSAMRGARTITRGPKPVRELKAYDVRADHPAPRATTDGVIEALQPLDLAARRVGVQRYGTEPNAPLMAALAGHGALALPVAPYIYADGAEDNAVARFIDAIVANRLDAVAFTSSPQVRRLFAVAERTSTTAALTAALNRLCVAAVGPRVAAALSDRAIQVDLVPETGYFMKPLVRALSDRFAPSNA